MPARAGTLETIGATTATVGMAVKSGARQKHYTNASKSRDARDNRDDGSNVIDISNSR